MLTELVTFGSIMGIWFGLQSTWSSGAAEAGKNGDSGRHSQRGF